jgi:hypothetical protein
MLTDGPLPAAFDREAVSARSRTAASAAVSRWAIV